jgi:hypothetical protein
VEKINATVQAAEVEHYRDWIPKGEKLNQDDRPEVSLLWVPDTGEGGAWC